MFGLRGRVTTTLASVLVSVTACGSNSASSPPAGSPSAVTVPAGVQFDPKPGTPSGQTPLVDPATLPVPGGASYPGCPALTPTINKGTAESMATQGSNRVVAAYRALTDGSGTNLHGGTDTVVWHSANGGPWALVDVRSALGPVLNQLTVAATPDGFAAFGSVISGCGSFAVSTAVVLISADGVTWTKTADLRTPFSTQPNRLWVVGKNLLLSGPEYVCGGNPFSDSGAINGQARFWRSSDAGHTWAEVPLASIGVIAEPAAPADPSGCDAGNGLVGYSAPEPVVSVAGSQAAIFGTDGTRVALSSDLTTWSAAPLPGLPATIAAGQQQRPVAASVVLQNGQIYAFSLVNRYSTTRRQYISGEEPHAWVSTDGGKTFTAEPQARPLDIDGDMAAVGVVASGAGLHGSYQMVGAAVELDVTASSNVATKALAYRSTAGTLEQWQQCAAAPGANCRFASLGTSSLAGRDLKGIDLDSADLGTADLSGADLTGANLRGATLLKANLTGTKLLNVTCPDGKPSDPSQPGKAACRL